MLKFWKYFKTAVLVWGFINLALVLFLLGWAAVDSYSRHTARATASEPAEPDLDLAKEFGDLKLDVVRTHGAKQSVLLSLFRAGRPVVTDYPLPLAEYGLDWLEVYDARVIRLTGNAYRIVLFGHSSENDVGVGPVWFLKYDGQMQVVKVLVLTNPRIADEDRLRLFGDVSVALPGLDGSDPHVLASVPTQVSVGDDIRIAPMLSAQGAELVRGYYGRMISARMAKLTGGDDAEMLVSYKKVSAELQKSLVPQVIPY